MSDDDLRKPANPDWSVAGVLGHMTFWDARALLLARKLQAGVPFSPGDDEPEDVDWINDATKPLIEAIEPGRVAELCLRMAEETDVFVASLPPERMYPEDPASPVNPFRADHRSEHVDQLEAALGSGA